MPTNFDFSNTSPPPPGPRLFDDSSLLPHQKSDYYDKFGFTPVDAEKHRALRKAYIEGLVWNLEYYYKGCTSWEWYYPYHYGPMLSDLVNIDNFLEDISFEDKLGEPLRPYEQLLGCLPPSSSDLLPEPYQWLMTSRKSPIIDFYPESFTVDMNGASFSYLSKAPAVFHFHTLSPFCVWLILSPLY